MNVDNFVWRSLRQLSIVEAIAATAVPSAIAFVGFHFLLPEIVTAGYPVLLAYCAVASGLLTGFVLAAILMLKKEAKGNSLSFSSRALLTKIKPKEWLLTLGVIVGVVALSPLTGKLSAVIINAINFEVPEYLPFFLNPDINPETATPMILGSGIDLGGRWDIFAAICLTLLLVALAEELYFRAWMLPKLSRYGNKAWIINGVLFALYHSFQMWLLPSILVASLGFAFLIYRTKSIIPAFVAHLLLDTFTIVSLIPLFLQT